MKADLHFHSKFSDGSFWPDKLVEIAKEKGLEMIALTDHDTFEGVPDFLKASDNFNIIGVPAIEIDFKDEHLGFKSELLGYFPDGTYVNTKHYIDYFKELRQKIAYVSLEKAKTLYHFSDLSEQELFENKMGEKCQATLYNRISITKVDVFKYFNDKGVHHGFQSYQQFKTDFFKDDVFLEFSAKPLFSECIKMINSDNGYAVLAHPAYQFGKNRTEILKNETEYKNNLKSAKMLGLWGIELHSYDSTREADELNEIFKRFAFECELNITYGSDFHSDNQMNSRQLGCVKSDFKGFNTNLYS
jgi:3',5'-nucleoside bisphosphate phosphatase